MSEEFLMIEATEKQNPRVMGLAYSGGKMTLPGWRHPVVVDLAGLEIPESVPLLTNHENRTGSRIGVVKAKVETDGLIIEGEILSTSGQAKGIVEQAKAASQAKVANQALAGADWQLSIGAEVKEAELVRSSRTVNDQTHSAPFYHVKKSVLREVSVVAVGADATTRMKIAAKFNLYGEPGVRADINRDKANGQIEGLLPRTSIAPAGHYKVEGDFVMKDFEKWLEAHNLDAAKLNEAEIKKLKAAFENGEEPPAPEPEDKNKKPESQSQTTVKASSTKEANIQAASNTTSIMSSAAREEAENAVRFERERVAAIQEICANEFPRIERDAIRSGWSVEDTSQKVLKAMRENRPQANVHLSINRDRGQEHDALTLEAACALSGGLTKPEEYYGEEALDLATKRFRGGISLQELFLEAAWANGYTGRTFRESREAMRYAFGRNVQAGLSTVDLGGILSNIANKFLIEGFYSVERTWQKICAIRNVSDFKTVTSYRLVGSDQYEQVAPGGELKHGTLGEESFSNKADTYGLLLSVDRRDIINDDLGAITLVPRKLGRGSGLKINDVFWTAFMNNSAFFTVGAKNYLSGADSALGIDGLTEAETSFMEQVDPEGKPIGVMPVILLVPPALNAIATQLNKSLELRNTNSNVKYPVANPHQGKFRAEVSRYLSNPTYTGNSAKAWYLLADPNDLPVIEMAFLNGKDSPVIETAEADFNVLGVQMRGYHDFGVALQDPRGGLKSKGEA